MSFDEEYYTHLEEYYNDYFDTNQMQYLECINENIDNLFAIYD